MKGNAGNKTKPVPSERRKFQQRMANRAYRHGKNWRQVVVDCGGMCLTCNIAKGLEFHELFGEDRHSLGKFQTRVLLCHDCHSLEHGEVFGGKRNIYPSQLLEDVDAEMIAEGGYSNWIKNHSLVDQFGCLITMKGEWDGEE